MHLTLLEPGTELADAVLARSPAVLRIVGCALGLLLAIAGLWAAVTTVDLVVRSPCRIRSASSPEADFDAASGDAVSAAIAGQIDEVLVKEGDLVAVGAPLARLDPRRLDNDMARLRHELAGDEDEARRGAELADELAREQARSEEKAQATIAEAEQALAVERQREAAAERDRANVERQLAVELARQEDNLRRLTQLFAKELAREADVAAARFAAERARLELDKARAPTPDGEATLAERRIETARSDLAVLRAGFAYRRKDLELQRSRRATEIGSLRATIDDLALDRGRCEIRSPAAGVVSLLRAQVGQTVQPGQALAFVVDPAGYRLDALVNAADIGQVKPGMRARVKIDAFDYQRFGTLDAVVDHVATDSQLTRDGAFYVVRLSLPRGGFADGSRLRVGMTGSAEIAVDRERLIRLVLGRARRAAGL